MENNHKPFKSVYRDGLIPTKEYHEIVRDIDKTIETIFKKYLDDGYSPREIAALIHTIADITGSDKALLLTIKRTKETKKSLKTDG